jgi:transcriptional repressor of dcmA and dcmR
MAEKQGLLDIKEAAALLSVTETTLRRWTNTGRLACLRIGAKRERRFRRADLEALLEHQPSVARQDRPGVDHPGEAAFGAAVVAGVQIVHGTHLCSLYTSNTGRTRLAVGFLADGLDERSACVLAASTAASREVVAQLEQRHPRVRDDLSGGRLMVLDYETTGAEQIAAFERLIVGALRRGFRSIRLVGNVSEGKLGRRASLDEIVRYEVTYERELARRFPLVTLCQYDAREHSGIHVAGILKCHCDAFSYPLHRLIM